MEQLVVDSTSLELLDSVNFPIDEDSINPFNLPSVSISELNQLPEVTSVYFLIRKRCVLYIGKAKNLRKRWKAHHKLKYARLFVDACVAWAEMPDCVTALKTESFLIDKFMPQLNGVVPEYLKTLPVRNSEPRILNEGLVFASKLHVDADIISSFAEENLANIVDNLNRIIYYIQSDYEHTVRRSMCFIESIQHALEDRSRVEAHLEWNNLHDDLKHLTETFSQCFLVGGSADNIEDLELDFCLREYPIKSGFHRSFRWSYPSIEIDNAFHDLEKIQRFFNENPLKPSGVQL